MKIPTNALFLAIDGGGHRQRLILTNRNAKIFGEREISYKENMMESELNSRCIKAARMLLSGAKNRLYAIAMGCSGIPQDDGTFTNNPNTPKHMRGRISSLPALAKAFNIPLERCVWTNDCSAGVMTSASPYGHKRMSFIATPEPVVATKGEWFRFRAIQRGDNSNKDYSKVAYTTISSGTNDGYVIIADVHGVGMRYILDKGEFKKTPEAGHRFYREFDPFENRLICGCGGVGHLEAAVAGGTGESGISGMMRKAVNTGKISKGKLYNIIKSTPNTEKGNLDLTPKLYKIREGADENADRIKRYVVEAVAHMIGYYWGVVGAGKVEFGGGMMHDYEQILIPAIKMILKNPRNFALQPDLSTFPDIAVAKDYGKDYIWQGPLFMALNKDKVVVTGRNKKIWL